MKRPRKHARPRAPERGDVVWLEFPEHRAGHEQAGRRPALVLSPRAYNSRTGLAIVCAVTSRVKGYPFEVLLPSGLPIEGAVLSDSVRSIDWHARKAQRACSVPQLITDAVRERLGTLI